VHTWDSKDPDEVLDYRVRWAAALQDGELLLTSEFILASGTVVFDSDAIDGTDTVLWLSGGTLNEVCVITNRVTTSMGRSYDETMRLRIRSK